MDRAKAWRRIIIGAQIIVILVVYALLWNRIRFGVEFTDESWYVAEPYIVAEGAIPYVNNWSQAPGFALPLAVFFKLYVVINGGTEGIVYFSRVLYAVASLAVYGSVVYMFWYRTHRDFVLISLAPLLFVNTYSLYDLNYNSMGVMYLFLSTALLFFVGDCERDFRSTSETKMKTGSTQAAIVVFSGITIARGIIASPSVLAAWVGILVILVCMKRYKKLLQFIIGNVIAATVVIGWCCIRGSVFGFINGMRVFFTKMAYFRIEPMHTIGDDVSYVINYLTPLWVVLILCGLALALCKIRRISLGQYKWLIVSISALCLLAGVAWSIRARNYEYVIRFGWFISIVIALFFAWGKDTENASEVQKEWIKNGTVSCENIIVNLAYISALYFVVYLLTSASNVYGFHDREYWLIIPMLLGIMTFGLLMQTGTSASHFVCSVVAIVMLAYSVLLIHRNYDYVYRDSSVEKLTEKVDYGIWKGCFTTPERAENVKRLEMYIHDITDKGDNVLFMDQVCFAYLMNDGKACTPSTADPMVWSYKVDDFEIMEEYFDAIETIPDKVIYIDFGRDEVLSVNGQWQFNDFLKAHYTLVDSYDTNPEVDDKHSVGDVETASFYVEYYRRNR